MSQKFTMISHNAALMHDTVLAIQQIIKHSLFDQLLYLGALIGFVGLLFQYIQGDNNASTKGWRMYLVGFLILFLAIKIETDLVLYDPVDGVPYLAKDAPLGLAAVGGATSIISSGFRTLFATNMSSPSGTHVLSTGGVGTGLAVLQGMQHIPWSPNSRNPQNTSGTNLEKSIKNYLTWCYAESVVVRGTGMDSFAVFYDDGAFDTLGNIWQRVKTDFVSWVDIEIDGPKTMTCQDAYESIKTEITKKEFKDSLVEDMTEHMARQIAAVSLPGTGVNTKPAAASGEEVNTYVKSRIKKNAEAIVSELFSSGGISVSQIVFLDRLNTMLLNAYRLTPQFFQKEPEGRLAAAWNDAQRQSDLSMAAQGDWFTRNAKPMTMIIEILIVAFLPIFAFAMFVGQQGMKGIMGSVGVMVWLQTWPIVYVIINHITIHTVVANFEPFLYGKNELGMLDLNMIFDQARHSYAVSQTMLGMTPLLTGMLLSGSVMMLTKVAGSMSGNENVDESRIHRNTESSAPIHNTQASSNAYLTANNGGAYADGTDPSLKTYKASGSVGASISSTEASIETEQRALGKVLTNAAAEAIRAGDTEAFNKIAEKTTGITDRNSFSYASEYAQASETDKRRIEATTASIAGQLSASGGLKGPVADALKKSDELKDGGKTLTQALNGVGSAQLALGLNAATTAQLSEAFKKTEAWKEATATALETGDGLSLKEGATIGSTLEHTSAEQYSNQVSKHEQNIKAFTRQLANQKTAAKSLEGNHEIKSGRVAQYANALKIEMENASRHIDNPEEKLAAMTEAAMEHGGLDEKRAARLAELLATGADKDQMRVYENNGVNTSFAGGNIGGYALFDAFDRKSNSQGDDTASFVLLSNLANKAELDASNENSPLNPYSNIPTGKPQNETGINPEKLNDEVAARTDAAGGLPDQELNLKHRTEAEAVKAEVNEGMLRKAKAQAKWIEDQNQAWAAMNEQEGKNTFSEISPLKDIRMWDLSEIDKNILTDGTLMPKDGSLNEMAKTSSAIEAKNNALSTIAFTAASLEESRAGGSSKEQLQVQAITSLSSLLRKDEQASMLKDLGGIDENDVQAILAALAPYEQMLNERGIPTDVSEITNIAEQIKGSQIRGATLGDNISDIGTGLTNLFRSSDNQVEGVSDKKNELAEKLHKMLNNYGANTEGGFANSDRKAIESFDNIFEAATERRPEDFGSGFTDILLAEVAAVSNYSYAAGNYEEMRHLIDELQASFESGSGTGIHKVLGLMSGSAGIDGISLAKEEFEKLAEKHLGEGGYEALRSQLPQELKQRIEELNNETVEAFNQYRNNKLVR